jgi:succinoglycan biosynthesis transport protein ExoP
VILLLSRKAFFKGEARTMDLHNEEIQKYLKVLGRRKFLFILLSLCIMSVIVWGSFFLPKEYEASSMIFIERNVINNLVQNIAISPSMNDRIRVLRYAILSRGLIGKVLRDLDIDVKLKTDRALEEAISDYQKRTNITVNGEDLFIVSIRDENPKVAADYVNRLVSRYVEENVSSKRQEAFGASRFITDELSRLKEQLSAAEDAVIKYRNQKRIYLVSDEQTLVADINDFQSKMEALKMKRGELVATVNSIKNQLKGEEPFTATVLKRTDGGSGNVAVLESRLKQLLIKYTDNYPEVIKLKAEIQAVKRQEASNNAGINGDGGLQAEESTTNPIYQDLRQRMLQAEAEVSAVDAQQKQLSALRAARENELRNMPEEKRVLSRLEEQRNIQKNLYDELLKRQGQSEVSKQMEVQDKSTTFRVVDPAVLPTKPVSPDRVKIILAAILFGCLGGFGGVLAAEKFDSSVKSVETLKGLGLVALAVIPKIYNEAEHKKTLKKERLLYICSGLYFMLIFSVLILEISGFTYLDDIATRLKLDTFMGTVVHSAKGLFRG